MSQNYQSSIKKVYRQYFPLCSLISIIFMKCSAAYDNAYFTNFGDEKVVTIDPEEIIRRQNVAKSYLKVSGNVEIEKDWIETYHGSFSESSIFTAKKIKDNSLENEYGIYSSSPPQNKDLPSLKNLDTSVHLRGSLFNGNDLSVNKKHEALSSKTDDQILQEFFKIDKNAWENEDTVKSSNDKIANSCVFKKSKIDSKNNENFHIKSRSKLNNLESLPINCDKSKDYKSDVNIRYSNTVKNELKLNEYKNITLNKNKIIQILIKKSKYISERYFINGETLTLTELHKLQKHLTSLSFLQKGKNNVYSVNRMKLIDSIGEITPLLKQDELGDKSKQLCESNFFICEENNIRSSVDFEKCLEHKTNLKKMANQEINNEKMILHNNLKKTNKKDFLHDPEMLRRKKLVDSFLTSLNENNKNWIDTYHMSNFKRTPDSKITYNVQKIAEKDFDIPKVYSQERLYIIRWINKLQNKLKDFHIDNHSSLSVLVSADLYKILGELTKQFDIVTFDELVNHMISNATLQKYTNTFYFDYKNIFNATWISNYEKFFIFIAFSFCCIFLCSLFFKTTLNNNFSLHRILLAFVLNCKWILINIIIIFSIFWHGYKMYQQKIAQKHSVISRVMPSYCESILVKESGILAHIKDYIRHWWHNEDCKKYYEAVMVDPSSEISFFSISTDLFSEAMSQMLQPFARNMNSFFKTLTYDLSYSQHFFIIPIVFFFFIVIAVFILSFLALYHNYRVNFPFHLGSIEPTELHKGSRVEEIEEKDSSNLSIINYKTNNQNINENFVSFKSASKVSTLNLVKNSVLKVPRTRHNSI